MKGDACVHAQHRVSSLLPVQHVTLLRDEKSENILHRARGKSIPPAKTNWNLYAITSHNTLLKI